MTIPQLKKLAKVYDCHIESAGHVVRVYAPDYSTSELISDLESKQAKDIQPILAKLSGKKTAELWQSGKGGVA